MRLLAFSFLVLLPLAAQEPPAAQPPAEGARRTPPAPKNLKILKPEQVMPAMRAFRASLGVQCTFCHVEGNFASDDNPHKDTARKMLTMTHEINSSNFTDGKMHVTCYTCHRGASEPATTPPAAAPSSPPPQQ